MIFRATLYKYGDEAISYVAIKEGEDDDFEVECQITPQQRLQDEDYIVTVQFSGEEIKDTSCTCRAGNVGCKHQTVFLFWLHYRAMEPPPTEVKNYWKPPR